MAKRPYSTNEPGSTRSVTFSRAVRPPTAWRRATASCRAASSVRARRRSSSSSSWPSTAVDAITSPQLRYLCRRRSLHHQLESGRPTLRSHPEVVLMSRIVSAATAVALSMAVAASLAQAAGGGNASTFVGTTSQFPCQRDTENRMCAALNIFMTKDMSRVKRLLIGFEAACDSQRHFYGATWSYSGIATTRSRHNATAAFSRQGTSEQQLNGGLTARVTTSLRGKVTYGRRGSGTFQITIDIVDQNGQTIDKCATGILPYHVQALKRS